MADLGRGVIAGLIATVVISLLMLMRLSAGIMTEYHPVEIMNLTAHGLFGTADSLLVGWPLHFLVGTVIWGSLFALVERRIPVGGWVGRGIIFGAVAWLIIMITIFPAAGSGFFAVGFGIAVPLMTLLGHLAYGAVLGGVYGWLKQL
ncbi:hypothetical protein H0Z60_02290 [Ectothiorhodospiraceae bacterium WFHF3C12]|nr:hypothetical protein [Ectothiorhodospiraceae bacterium WFHF3C12]